jgi:2-phosphosulfolactate phosphatase
MYYFNKSVSIFCEWGEKGIESLRDHVDVFVIVDVLSFSTCVDIAVSRGASVYPYLYKDETAIEYARSIGAVCASAERSKTALSLSSHSLLQIESGVKLVLPSPNGSHLSRIVGDTPTFCGSLRNADAVAAAAQAAGERIAVIPAGERWPDGSIRFALEDWLGAGAIISKLVGKKTVKAKAASNTFDGNFDLLSVLRSGASGIELIERGFPEDVELAAQLNISTSSPRMDSCAYVSTEESGDAIGRDE